MKQDPAAKVPNNDELEKALAILISSTRSKKRPMALTEIAKWLEIAVSKLGSYNVVADRVGLSSKMLRQFATVSNLSPQVREMISSRQIDSVDAVAHLAKLPLKQQQSVAEALASGRIDTGDVRAVVQILQEQQMSEAEPILRRVEESKTKREYIAEFVIRGSREADVLRRAFKQFIPTEEILRLEIEGATGRLILTKRGKQSLARAARTLGIPFSNVIPAILNN